MIDRNSKEHPQNEVNQKELPQLKKHFTKKQRASRQKSFDVLPSKTFIRIMYVYIAHNIKQLENIFLHDFIRRSI